MAVNILLYSEDKYVSKHLQTLLSAEKRSFSVFHFTDLKKAEEYFEKNEAKLRCVIASEDLLGLIGSNKVVKICLDDTTRADDASGYSINIFQNKTLLLEDLLTILRNCGLVAKVQQHNAESTKVISFISTQGGSGCTTLAYLTAIKSAETGKTIYLNLENAPCVRLLYRTLPTANAEEYLYALQDRAGEQMIMGSLGCNEHGVYVFPIISSLQDRMALTKADVDYLLDMILQSGEVQNVIVDLSGGLGEIESLVLERSDRVVLPYNDEQAGAAKREQLEADPNYSTFPFARKEFWAGNRCKSEYKDGRYQVCFPVSNSLASVSDLRMILVGNPAFSSACAAILSLDM